jgi:probable F420-dependent oxidoreductase
VLPGGVTLEEAERLAAEAEHAGASSIWVLDLRREPYLVAMAALRGTRHTTVGTGVAVAFARSPVATAQAAWDLAKMSGGRFTLGLGSQVGPTLKRRFGVDLDRPVARMRDYARAVRSCWAAYRAGRGIYEGEFYSIRQPVFGPGADKDWPDDPKIYLAGVNPNMTELAGEVADGFAAHMFNTTTYLEGVSIPALSRGAARAGRERPPVLVQLVVGPSSADLAMQLTTYVVPAYRKVLDESGMRDEADAILAALAEHRRADAARIIEARCLRHLGVSLVDEVEATVARWTSRGVMVAIGPPWYGTDHATQVALFRDTLRRLAAS